MAHKVKSVIRFFAIFFLIATSVFCGMVGAMIQNDYDILSPPTDINKQSLNTTTVKQISLECSDIGRIDKQLECVMNHVDNFYYYKVRPDDENITFNELMNNGGDCGNWADFWEYFAEDYGYDIKPIRISSGNNTAHRFSILSTNQGYCKVDQRNLDCYIYG